MRKQWEYTVEFGILSINPFALFFFCVFFSKTFKIKIQKKYSFALDKMKSRVLDILCIEIGLLNYVNYVQ